MTVATPASSAHRVLALRVAIIAAILVAWEALSASGLLFRDVTASGRMVPLAIAALAAGIVEMTRCTVLLCSARIVSESDLYGMCIASSPVAPFRYSIFRWLAVPVPADAKLSLPLFFWE